MYKLDYTKPEYFDNRELSWLEFNKRVLTEAKDISLPLLERIKFLSITASNLDEFVMVRVASLKDMVHADYNKKDIAGMTPSMQLEKITEECHKLVDEQYELLNETFIPSLSKNNIHLITSHEELTIAQEDYIDRFFMSEVYPVLTPMGVDSSRPFPLLRHKSLNIAALLHNDKINNKE